MANDGYILSAQSADRVAKAVRTGPPSTNPGGGMRGGSGALEYVRILPPTTLYADDGETPLYADDGETILTADGSTGTGTQGIITLYDASTGTWTDFAQVNVIEVNGTPLVTGEMYPARQFGSDGLTWVAFSGYEAGGDITGIEIAISPSTVVTKKGAGICFASGLIDVSDYYAAPDGLHVIGASYADFTTIGIVDITAQMFAGTKSFQALCVQWSPGVMDLEGNGHDLSIVSNNGSYGSSEDGTFSFSLFAPSSASLGNYSGIDPLHLQFPGILYLRTTGTDAETPFTIKYDAGTVPHGDVGNFGNGPDGNPIGGIGQYSIDPTAAEQGGTDSYGFGNSLPYYLNCFEAGSSSLSNVTINKPSQMCAGYYPPGTVIDFEVQPLKAPFWRAGIWIFDGIENAFLHVYGDVSAGNRFVVWNPPTGSGSSLIPGSFLPGLSGTLADGSTVTGGIVTAKAAALPYSPATPSNWAGTPPTTVAEALDRLAAVASTKP